MRTKICIATPVASDGVMKAKTALCLMNIVKQAKNYEVLPIFQFGAYVSENRRDMILLAQQQGCSHILFVDYDMYFGPDTLNCLLANNKDIVGVNYNMRKLPLQSTVLLEKNEIEMPNTLFKCRGIAMGLVLIKMSVFDKISRPWIRLQHDDEGNLIGGEDYYFCDKARQAGFDIWCDGSISVKHLGDFAY